MKRYVLLVLLIAIMCTLLGCQYSSGEDKTSYRKQMTETSTNTEVYETSEGDHADEVVNLTEDELILGIDAIANNILKDRLTITVRHDTMLITVFYEGPYNGGSEQSQASVNAAFEAVKEYLNSIGMQEYQLKVLGYDGYPAAEDDVPTQEPTEDVAEGLPTDVPYTLIAQAPNTKEFIFEVIASESTANAVGQQAVETLKESLQDKVFMFFVVDENEKVLGSGSSAGYEPFVYNKNKENYESGSYLVPFDFYIAKYFGYENLRGYDPYTGYMAGGRTYCEFSVTMMEIKDVDKYKEAAQKIRRLMNLTLGQDIKIMITVFPDTKSEFTVETVFKEDVFPWVN